MGADGVCDGFHNIYQIGYRFCCVRARAFFCIVCNIYTYNINNLRRERHGPAVFASRKGIPRVPHVSLEMGFFSFSATVLSVCLAHTHSYDISFLLSLAPIRSFAAAQLHNDDNNIMFFIALAGSIQLARHHCNTRAHRVSRESGPVRYTHTHIQLRNNTECLWVVQQCSVCIGSPCATANPRLFVYMF